MKTQYTNSELSWLVRRHVLEMIHASKSSYIASNFSEVEIIASLYNSILNVDPKNPHWENRDYFILSKPHASASLYATLAEVGYFPTEELINFAKEDSILSKYVSSKVPGVEASFACSGHGLSYAIGIALGLKMDHKSNVVYVLLGDGECANGQIYEGLLFASQHKLDNLVVLIDCNKISGLGSTKDVINIEPLEDKFKSFNFETHRIDGHDTDKLVETIHRMKFNHMPKVVICDTISGKGISFMENDIMWQHRYPHNEEGEYLKAYADLKSKQPYHVKDPYKL